MSTAAGLENQRKKRVFGAKCCRCSYAISVLGAPAEDCQNCGGSTHITCVPKHPCGNQIEKQHGSLLISPASAQLAPVTAADAPASPFSIAAVTMPVTVDILPLSPSVLVDVQPSVPIAHPPLLPPAAEPSPPPLSLQQQKEMEADRKRIEKENLRKVREENLAKEKEERAMIVLLMR
jgi:hypothetical protein